MADRNRCFGMGSPLLLASIRNSYAFHVPTLCATTCTAHPCDSWSHSDRRYELERFPVLQLLLQLHVGWLIE